MFAWTFEYMQFFNGLNIPFKKLTKLHIWMYIICNILLRIFKASFKPNVKAYSVGHINIGM
jgi:hypothetical protein